MPEAYLFVTPGVMEGSSATVTITLSEPSDATVVVSPVCSISKVEPRKLQYETNVSFVKFLT